MRALLLAVLPLAALAGACHPEEIDPMEHQAKLAPYGTSRVFHDGLAMRLPPAGAVPRERDLDEAQPAVTPALLELGRAKFGVVCAPCHGVAGDGNSIVAGKMSLRPPPSLHEPRIRALQAGEIYTVISEGYGMMPRLSVHLKPDERWAVIAYVRALQLGQNTPPAVVPDAQRQKTQETP